MFRVGVLALSLDAVAGFGSTPTHATCDKHFVVVGAGGGGAPMAYGLVKAGCHVTLMEKGPDDDDEALAGYPLWSAEFSWVAQQKAPLAKISTQLFSEDVWDGAQTNAARDWSSKEGGDTASVYSEWNYYANIVGGNTMHNLGFWLRGDCTVSAQWGAEWGCDSTVPVLEEIEALYGHAAHTPDGKLLESKKAGFTNAADMAVMDAFMTADFSMVDGKMVGGKGLERSVGFTEWTTTAGPTVAPARLTHDGPTRLSTGTVFVDPIRNYPNFQLMVNSWVSKVNIEDGRATGVTYMDTMDNMDSNAIHTVVADEVIISSGAVYTPQLLLVSGVGPKEQLEPLGIHVHADVPVGKDYQNHVLANAIYCYTGSDSDLAKMGQGGEGGVYQVEFPAFPPQPFGKMDATTWPITQANVWSMASSSVAKDGISDLAIFMFSNAQALANTPLNPTDPNSAPSAMCESAAPGSSAIVVFIGVMQGRSRGSVEISSADIMQPPLLKPGFFTDEAGEDMKVLTEGFVLAREILTAASFVEAFPGPDYQTYATTATSQTFWHDGCTTPMGKVVDGHLRVMGVEGLRVADNSVCSLLSNLAPSPNIQMTGLHGAHLIAQEMGLH